MLCCRLCLRHARSDSRWQGLPLLAVQKPYPLVAFEREDEVMEMVCDVAREGHVNRLKLIKRMGYGRADLPLLRQRVLHAL